jgi:type I restriction enzyme S subunit
LLNDGDLIIAMTDLAHETKILGLPTLVHNASGRNFLLNQRVGKLYKFSKKIYVPYLRYFLSSPEVIKYYKSKGAGGLQINISKKDILSVQIKLPSLVTQQKIVEKLDAIFAEIDKAAAAADANVKHVDALFNSYCSYFFGNHSLNCETKNIGELCDLMTGGTPSSKTEKYYKDGTIPWLVSGDINLEEIFDCQGRITQLGYEDSNVKYLPVNSVLIALNGQGKTRGTVAMLRIRATCNQSLVSIFPKNEKQILPDLIYYTLKSRYVEIRKLTGDGGNDRRGLNLPLIRAIKITYPKDIKEQEKLVETLKFLSLNIKSLKNSYQNKAEEIHKIKNSILSLAFNGELVKE